jgi:hypothetical protein
MLARFKEDAAAMTCAVSWGNAGHFEGTARRTSQTTRSLIELKQA